MLHSPEASEALLSRLRAIAKQNADNGPQTGIFTDGSCTPNPGPGGWGAVAVAGGRIEWTAYGGEADTTNNRMEMSALIAALERLPEESTATLYSDSNLCVRTLNEWAAGWERRGWKRSGGEQVKNVDLVRTAYNLHRARPNVSIKWLKAHAGATWNEVADELASEQWGR